MLDGSTLKQVIGAIVTQQQLIIGPLAIEQANKVEGLVIQGDSKLDITVTTKGSSHEILEKLVHKYEELFGKTSVEVCKDAVRESGIRVPADDLPDVLR